MSEHSIEELERQWKQSRDRVVSARDAERAAKARFLDAKFEATGFKGCLAEFRRSGRIIKFLPVRCSTWGSCIEGPRLKKDGTPGLVDAYCEPEVATNLGPYTQPA